jgi:hypothetical protein
MKNETSAILAAAVDQLAILKSQIAQLQEQESALKQSLADSSLDIVEGTTHRAAVSHCDGRITTDWRAIAEYLQPSRQLIQAHTTQGEPYSVVRLSAKKTS